MSTIRTTARRPQRSAVGAGLLATLMALVLQGTALAVPGWSSPSTAVPAPPSALAHISSHSITTDGGGHVHLAYTVGPDMRLHYATNRSGQWERTRVLRDPLDSATISIALHAGEVYIAYARDVEGGTPTVRGIWLAKATGGVWTHRRLVAGPYRAPSIKVLGGRIHVAYAGLDGVHYRRIDGQTSVHTLVKGYDTYTNGSIQLEIDSRRAPIVSFVDDPYNGVGGVVQVCRKRTTSFRCRTLGDGNTGSASMTVDDEDTIHVVWEQTDAPDNAVGTAGPSALPAGVHYAHDAPGSWVRSLVRREGRLGSAAGPAVAVGTDNAAHIVYGVTGEGIFYALKTSGGFARTRLSGSNEDASIDVDRDDLVHVVYGAASRALMYTAKE